MAHKIMHEIQQGMADFIANNNGTPTIIYLGRKETTELGVVGYELGYLPEPGLRANGEGFARPEVAGLKVFEVNADSHMGFAR